MWPANCYRFVSILAGKNAMSTKKKARKTLTLKQKCELIDVAKKNPHLGSSALAEKFGCGKMQVNTILSKRESIIEQYESNVSMTVFCWAKGLVHVSLLK